MTDYLKLADEAENLAKGAIQTREGVARCSVRLPELTVSLASALRELHEENQRLEVAVRFHMEEAQREHVEWSGATYEEKVKNANLRAEVARLKEELEKKDEALGEYADEGNWRRVQRDIEEEFDVWEGGQPPYEVARAALSPTAKEETNE